MDLCDTLRKKLQPVLDTFHAAAADGKVTLEEGMRVIRQAARQAVDLAQLYGEGHNLSGADKKSAVDATLLWVFDAIWPKIVMPGWLSMIVHWLPTRVTRAAFLVLADSLIEMAVSYLPKRVPSPVVPSAPAPDPATPHS